MNSQSNLKRPLLYALVGSVVLGALLGIALVMQNTWGWFEVRVMLTTVTVAIASLCGLACDLSRTPRGANILPRCGLLLTLVAASLILVGMWTDMNKDGFWKVTASVSIFAVATVHICLLSIARLAKRFRWVYFVACQVIYGLAVLLSVIVFWVLENERMFRFVAMISIVDAALTLVIPLLHRISRTDDLQATIAGPMAARNVAAIEVEIGALKKRIAELEKLRLEMLDRDEE